ncbi:LEAF RUST 10 DISEASE-RESISTANCE LOCUS RECEPTOR-LIKE PROTEIN KINASE-like 2.7 [Tripterygium wilfordii]|uniref:LEAF RUST 10 DISEASE-RESISTANCE LOCUS RECEPTOR-LIKE PROTEIN KINASE-like 2.7 n=1 Tax=Tripterygium wilfordii TaxID=458696 RepID=UPI0018F80282|nr:LEAF RUST 10 DISEASE-RESISTANCE LOCUS RECEPTOR-LIKE PROTEIN KINASE-like 2.7 [Tripterygium wilfordii]
MNQCCSFTILFFFILACAEEDQDFLDCSFHDFNCGELVNISYPFWGNGRPQKCGHRLFELKCLSNGTTTIFINQHEYQVVGINNFSHSIKISRPRERCPSTFGGETVAYTFNYSNTVQNLTLFYNCTTTPYSSLSSNNFLCPVGGTERDAFYGHDILFGGAGFNDTACNIQVKVPVEEEILDELIQNGVGQLDEALKEPFGVNYFTYVLCDSCVGSGGNCGTNLSSSSPVSQFICFCHDGHHRLRCDDDKGMHEIFFTHHGSLKILFLKSFSHLIWLESIYFTIHSYSKYNLPANVVVSLSSSLYSFLS